MLKTNILLCLGVLLVIGVSGDQPKTIGSFLQGVSNAIGGNHTALNVNNKIGHWAVSSNGQSSPFTDQIKSLISQLPSFTSTHNAMAKALDKESLIHDTALLQFLDDTTIRPSWGCGILSAFLAWMSLVFSALFIINNQWFFLSHVYPHQVSMSELSHHHDGLWAFAASSMFAMSCLSCTSSELTQCQQTSIIGNILLYPSTIMFLWGLISSASLYEKSRQEKLKGETSNETWTPSAAPYAWRLNQYASQGKESLTKSVAARDETKTRKGPKLDSTNKLVKSGNPEFKVIPAYTIARTLEVFLSYSPIAMAGLIMLLISLTYASVGCDSSSSSASPN